jgi:hypothetical protein
MASYYDRVLEDFDINESESIYDEGILDEGILDEGIYDEATRKKPSRPVKLPGSIGRASNFGRTVSPASNGNGTGNYVTKTELKNSLNSISEQVNDLKKTGLSLASSIKRLDDGYEKIVKSIARKDKTQDNIISSTTMMTLLSTIANKPTLDATTLKVVNNDGSTPNAHIEVTPNTDAIQVDLTKTLLFTMLPSLTSSNGSGDGNMMMMLMLVLVLGQNKSTTGTDNTLLLLLPMMMMMSNKK